MHVDSVFTRILDHCDSQHLLCKRFCDPHAHLSIRVDGRVLLGWRMQPCERCISTFDYLCYYIHIFVCIYNAQRTAKVTGKAPNLYLQVCAHMVLAVQKCHEMIDICSWVRLQTGKKTWPIKNLYQEIFPLKNDISKMRCDTLQNMLSNWLVEFNFGCLLWNTVPDRLVFPL